MKTLAALIPTLNRPAALAALYRNLMDTAPDVFALFIVNSDDRESQAVVSDVGAHYLLCNSGYPGKANAGARATTEPLVLVAGDDVVFHHGWYEAAVEAFRTSRVMVVGGPDMSPITAGGAHVTMPIVRRSYLRDPGGAYGEPGAIYFEGYHHNYSETELWQLAQHRGCARFVEGCVIEHKHPNWGTAPMDDTYVRGGFANSDQDRATFERRRIAWEA